jgi:two-component system, NarL family, nitrate/nitrite response regulator NarL
MQPIRLLLLDDHILFRESLSRLLASEPDFEMVAHCSTLGEAMKLLARLEIDVVLLDFDLGDEQGTQFLPAARGAGYTGKVLLVTAGMNPVQSSAVLKGGASGIFLKHNSPSALANAIRQVAQGELWVDPKLVQQMADQVPKGEERSPHRPFTQREQIVLRGLFEGLSNKEIATQIGVSEGAVKATLQQLFQKTNVRTRSQLVRIALEGSFGMSRRG